MKNQKKKKFEEMLKDLPVFLTVSDLVKLGLYSSRAALSQSKMKGEAPPSINLSKRRMRFCKIDLINWLCDRKSGDKFSSL